MSKKPTKSVPGAPPPYPVLQTSVPRLLELLLELAGWVTAQHGWAKSYAKQKGLPESVPQSLLSPGLEQLQTLELFDLTYAYVTARGIRHAWDDLVRNYEHNWESDECRQKRIKLLQDAVGLFLHVLIPQEQRELRQEQQQLRQQQRFQATLRKMGFPDNMIGPVFFKSDLDPADDSPYQSGQADLSGGEFDNPEDEQDGWPT
jgi:hypothetical protein